MKNQDHKPWVEPCWEQRRKVQAILTAEGPVNHQALEAAWRSYFFQRLYGMGWNKIAIQDLFTWGASGHNWKALWHGDTEGKVTPEDREAYRGHMSSDFGYFSDRMSMDRLFRLHWWFNGIQNEYRHSDE